MQPMQALQAADLIEVPRAQRCPLAKSLDNYIAETTTNQDAMLNAFASGDYSMQQIAKHFRVHYSTVSRSVRRVKSGYVC